jgi:DNA-directed RNA polymerase subunit M/transcription elongation factor TFIIS
MAIWKLKSCPRCNGDVFVQRETEGWYEGCLLCGYEREVSNLISVNSVGQIKIDDSEPVGKSRTDDQIFRDN